MPEAEARKRRRVTPCFFASVSAISRMRASTCFWRVVCGDGMNSSLETDWVGIGPAKAWVSAGSSPASSRSLSSPMDSFSSRLAGARQFEECAHHVPELVAGVAERDGVRGASQDDELPVGAGQAAIELQQVLLGGDAV